MGAASPCREGALIYCEVCGERVSLDGCGRCSGCVVEGKATVGEEFKCEAPGCSRDADKGSRYCLFNSGGGHAWDAGELCYVRWCKEPRAEGKDGTCFCAEHKAAFMANPKGVSGFLASLPPPPAPPETIPAQGPETIPVGARVKILALVDLKSGSVDKRDATHEWRVVGAPLTRLPSGLYQGSLKTAHGSSWISTADFGWRLELVSLPEGPRVERPAWVPEGEAFRVDPFVGSHPWVASAMGSCHLGNTPEEAAENLRQYLVDQGRLPKPEEQPAPKQITGDAPKPGVRLPLHLDDEQAKEQIAHLEARLASLAATARTVDEALKSASEWAGRIERGAEAATLAEREACARILDTWAGNMEDEGNRGLLRNLAYLIRHREAVQTTTVVNTVTTPPPEALFRVGQSVAEALKSLGRNSLRRGQAELQEAHTMSNQKPASPTPTMLDKLSAAAGEVQESALRTAGTQFVKNTREPLIALLSRNLGPGDDALRGKLAAFLATDLGEALHAGLLSLGLSMLPPGALGPLPAHLARELRVRSMAEVGDVLADLLMGPLREVLCLYLQGSPAESSSPPPALEAQPARVGVPVAEVIDAESKVGR